MPSKNDRSFTITAAGAEGDTAVLKVNLNHPLSQVLREALKALYGTPTPDTADYDIIFDGVPLDVEKTVGEASLVEGAEVAVLPKDVSRG